jgi:carbon storage regulator CsrA
MLVLSRKTQESVMVGGPGGAEQMLKVTVVEIRSGYVRLGFEADAKVAIHRSEVWEQIRNGGRPDLAEPGPPAPAPVA